jgi:hypothetical protein
MQIAGARHVSDAEKVSHGCPTVGRGTQAKPPSADEQKEASSHAGPAPQLGSAQVPVPDPSGLLQVVPAAQSMRPMLLSTQGWPAPGNGWHVPKVLTAVP